MNIEALGAAISYLRRGWPIFPMAASKRPLTEHGLLDATRDEAQIRDWWRRWPDALPALVTGKLPGIIGLDVDMRPGISGFDSLEALGVRYWPATPTTHTPSGCCHLLFGHPGGREHQQ